MENIYDGVSLFSGGLDSILAARVLADQGLRMLCLHFWSPFFGSPSSSARERWKRLYGVEVEALDCSREMAALVSGWPPHGFGKVMNPCVDCKILLLRLAKRRMEELGAKFIATGEVMGQRPMSQRRDVLNTIRREAGVDGLLLRPLSALHLDPTPMETSGLVDRSRLLGIHGRGRQDQLALAKAYGFEEIPSPGGGCWLAERENARRYWPIRTRLGSPSASDYRLAAWGRQYWLLSEGQACWLVMGRNSYDNETLKKSQESEDLLAGVCDYPGPLALLRRGRSWTDEARRLAGAMIASYAPKAVQAGGEIGVWMKERSGVQTVVRVLPDMERTSFTRMTFDEVKAEKHLEASRHQAEENLERERRRRERLERKAAEPAPSAGEAGESQPAGANPDSPPEQGS